MPALGSGMQSAVYNNGALSPRPLSISRPMNPRLTPAQTSKSTVDSLQGTCTLQGRMQR